MREPSAADVDFAARVIRRHGGTLERVEMLPGVVNRVLRVVGAGTDWVVRSPVDPSRPDEFPVEVWAAEQAGRLGVPGPGLVGTGHLDGRPYLVLEHVAPQAEPDADQLWRWLGRCAAEVALVPLDGAPDAIFSRFGRDLPAAWRSHLAYNLGELTPRDPLIAEGVYGTGDLSWIRGLLDSLRATDFRFGLAHGDLAPRNLIPRPAPAPPLLIDWGTATTGPAVWTDLQRVHAWAVHDRTVSMAALHRFADAAGLPLDEEVISVLTQLTALRFLDLARWAREHRPDLQDQYCRAAREGLQVIAAGMGDARREGHRA